MGALADGSTFEHQLSAGEILPGVEAPNPGQLGISQSTIVEAGGARRGSIQ